MKKLFTLLLSVSLILSFVLVSAGSQAADTADAAEPLTETAAEDQGSDDLVVTQHSAVIGGQKINYTATTGTMTVTSGEGQCEIFFIAYTMDGVENMSERPITFAFNGGPGSSSEWMHMGFLGPRRIDFDENGQASVFPVPIVDNDYSVLDITDLVFIDPVGTGYSKAAEGSDESVFLGYDNDLRSVGDFIRLYVTRNGRWSSPKYICGESYGTTRAVGLSGYLSDTYAMGINGLLLVSSINDFSTAMDDYNPSDLSYALYLPTYTADAWYHKKLSEEYQNMELEDLLKEVREFADGDYLTSLFKGRSLSDEKKEEIAKRLSEYTGLDEQYILESNLRVHYVDFCTNLLKDRKLVIGRIDGRYTGPVTSGNMGDGASDPSNAALSDIFGTAVNQYINDELGYATDMPYSTLSITVNAQWTYPQNVFSGFGQENLIYETMSKNRFLKIWVLCGYYDMATPFHTAEWTYDHVFLNEDYVDNLKFSYFPSGHMIYMHEPSLVQFRAQAQEWFK